MKQYLIITVIIIFHGSCKKKPTFNKENKSEETVSKVIDVTVVNDDILISKNEEYDKFDLFFLHFKSAIKTNENKKIANYVDFPFNEIVDECAFLKSYKMSEEIKHLILNSIPEKTDSLYSINSDSYDIRFIINKNGFWKLKSIYEGE